MMEKGQHGVDQLSPEMEGVLQETKGQLSEIKKSVDMEQEVRNVIKNAKEMEEGKIEPRENSVDRTKARYQKGGPAHDRAKYAGTAFGKEYYHVAGLDLYSEYKDIDVRGLVEKKDPIKKIILGQEKTVVPYDFKEQLKKRDEIGTYIELKGRKFYNLDEAGVMERINKGKEGEHLFCYSVNEDHLVLWEADVGVFVGTQFMYNFSDGSISRARQEY